MTRRTLLLSLLGVGVTANNVTARAGLHVKGRLVEDASDLQVGYFSLCGAGTGTCRSLDAIGLSVHPNNDLYLKPLSAMVGREVNVSIFAI